MIFSLAAALSPQQALDDDELEPEDLLEADEDLMFGDEKLLFAQLLLVVAFSSEPHELLLLLSILLFSSK